MNNQVRYESLQNRREFMMNVGKTGIGIFMSGIALNALAYENPTESQIKKYIFDEFQNLKEAGPVPYLLNSVRDAKVPFDYEFTKRTIALDYNLRWKISYTLSDLTDKQLRGILDGNDARLLYLWEPNQLGYKEKFNLIDTIEEADLTLIQKPSEIKPIEPIKISIDKKIKGESNCTDVIIQIIFEALTGIKLRMDKIAELGSDFIDLMHCIVKEIKEENMEKLEQCLIKLAYYLFSSAFLKLLKKILVNMGYKNLVKFTATRFVPIVGLAFCVLQLMLAIKGNWLDIRELCLKEK